MKKLIFCIALTLTSIVQAQNTVLKTKIAQKAAALENQVIQWRRDFHQNPELGNSEFKTAEKIATYLKSIGIQVQTGVAKTGVVGILKGGKPGPVVALRADMDALPVKERVKLPFASKAEGEYNNQKVAVMHACGHDTHVAMLMGTATILSELRKDIKGTVKFIFQPAEEGAPEGEEGGAALMIKEGVLENPKPVSIFGQHVATNVPVGKIGFREGMYMASTDELYIKVIGKGGHGAMPDACIDPIVIASHIIVAMQQIISRNKNPKLPSVLTFGKIEGLDRKSVV